MFGSWNRPIDPHTARQLLIAGATVVDVRSPEEFSAKHLGCAVNLPLESLPQRLGQLPQGTILLHCKSGMRSNMAARLLKRQGIEDVHNLGSYERAESIVDRA